MNKSERNLGNLHVKTNVTTYGFMSCRHVWIYLPKSWQRPATSTHNTSSFVISCFPCTCCRWRRWRIIFPAKWHTLQINQYFYFIARYFHVAYDLIKLMRLKKHRRYKFLEWYRFQLILSNSCHELFQDTLCKIFWLRFILHASYYLWCSGSQSLFWERMRLPSTLCTTPSRFSIKPLVFCATDVVLK